MAQPPAPQAPGLHPASSPWQQPPASAVQPDASKERRDAIKAKIITIGGGIVTVLLILVGVLYIFGLSLPENCSVGGATPIEVNQPVTGEFTAFRATQLYEFTQEEAGEVVVTARFDAEMYIELQHAGRPIQRGVGRVTAPLSPGVYQIMIRPYRQGSGSYTVMVSSQDAVQPPTDAPILDAAVPAPPVAH